MNLRQDIVVDKIGFIMPTKIVVGEGLLKHRLKVLTLMPVIPVKKQKPIC